MTSSRPLPTPAGSGVKSETSCVDSLLLRLKRTTLFLGTTTKYSKNSSIFSGIVHVNFLGDKKINSLQSLCFRRISARTEKAFLRTIVMLGLLGLVLVWTARIEASTSGEMIHVNYCCLLGFVEFQYHEHI